MEERKILAEAGRLTELAGSEVDALEQRADEELTPEEQMRLAQLNGVLHYNHRSRERIGQARSQLRQRQAKRAALRAAAGLSNLKRADLLLTTSADIILRLDGLGWGGRGLLSSIRAGRSRWSRTAGPEGRRGVDNLSSARRSIGLT